MGIKENRFAAVFQTKNFKFREIGYCESLDMTIRRYALKPLTTAAKNQLARVLDENYKGNSSVLNAFEAMYKRDNQGYSFCLCAYSREGYTSDRAEITLYENNLTERLGEPVMKEMLKNTFESLVKKRSCKIKG